MSLLTTEEVATMLRCSPRTVRRLKLAYCKPHGRRMYQLSVVEQYLKDSTKCPSSGDRRARSTIRKSRSEGVGLSEALELTAGARR